VSRQRTYEGELLKVMDELERTAQGTAPAPLERQTEAAETQSQVV